MSVNLHNPRIAREIERTEASIGRVLTEGEVFAFEIGYRAGQADAIQAAMAAMAEAVRPRKEGETSV